jgi:ABC-2 type transport system ATP-binding protein
MEGSDLHQHNAIQTFNLGKEYGRQITAVENLNLSLRKGEIFSLLGPNGAGKTTTIKMLCCLTRPSAGSATIMGKDIVKDSSSVKKLINLSPQETAVANHLGVIENLMLIGRIYGLDQRTVRKRAAKLIDLMELGERTNEPVKKLSGGMLRRLSIAMALITNPQVLFLDEPTLGLDPKSRKTLWSIIERLKGHKTILLTTHYLEEADALADRLAIIDKGKLVAIGTSNELKHKLGGVQSMTVRTENLSKPVFEKLRAVYPATTITRQGLVIKDQNLVFEEILALLHSGGVNITWLSMHEPTLDDVYLKIIRGGDKDENA